MINLGVGLGWADLKAALPVVKDALQIATAAATPLAGLAYGVRRWRTRAALVKRIRADAPDYWLEKLRASTRAYIEPYGATEDPSAFLHYGQHPRAKEPIFAMLRDRLRYEQQKFYGLILADSGMGKSTLLENLFIREARKKFGQRTQFALISLAQKDPIGKIRQIDSPRDKVLLLDAFDEDQRAYERVDRRMAELLGAAEDFAGVIVTCRTQFFLNAGTLPLVTGRSAVGSYSANGPSAHELSVIYLVPFTVEQIRSYLWRKIPFYRPQVRQRALAIARTIEEESTRPMLLEVITRIAQAHHQEHERYGLFQLYHELLNFWSHRERKWVAPQTLLLASRLLARAMARKRLEGQPPTMAPVEATAMLREQGVVIEEWRLRSRSLLNRTETGDLKFSHLSILEYFLVLDVVDHGGAQFPPMWSDQMRAVFIDWLQGAPKDAADLRLREITSSPIWADAFFPLIKNASFAGSDRAHRFPLELAQEACKAGPRYFDVTRLPRGLLRLAVHIVHERSTVLVYNYIDETAYLLPVPVEVGRASKPDLEVQLRVGSGHIDRAKGDALPKDLRTLGVLEFIRLVCVICQARGALEGIAKDVLYWVDDVDRMSLGAAGRYVVSVSDSDRQDVGVRLRGAHKAIARLPIVPVEGLMLWVHLLQMAAGHDPVALAPLACSGVRPSRYADLHASRTWVHSYLQFAQRGQAQRRLGLDRDKADANAPQRLAEVQRGRPPPHDWRDAH
jgi:hypothetical protein